MNTNTPDPFPVYIENQYHLGMTFSIVESFLLIFFAELGDKTFIMLIILQMKANHITILLSALFTQLTMNCIAVFVGFGVDFLLYKNLIDWVGILFFSFYGLWVLVQSFHSENKSFEKELHVNVIPHTKWSKKKDVKCALTIIPEMPREDTKYLSEALTLPLIDDELPLIKEEENEKESAPVCDMTMFWIIASSMALSECGDRTQFSSMIMASIFNVPGVLIGSTIALIMTNLLGVYLGKILIKNLHEKTLNLIAGLIFTGYAVQICLGKYYFQ